ncbi:hypothetical protein MGG_16818 [Pyricularia oryzae 70-15]|uniref:Uncharacterized protein n=1 Tax=Pyricularia oryzae (strain 70-15 / ATCC MYA-4617 / FGSC 8958) TaxID=242507 RepID=G4N2B9_PYRO7|nr:uncharacterized protein MGG_16818 [Pyricularia oryzae 70-15]EHA52531.1 hypothetical protein MGG_16818 [Pyricularia oryzae 70-15]
MLEIFEIERDQYSVDIQGLIPRDFSYEHRIVPSFSTEIRKDRLPKRKRLLTRIKPSTCLLVDFLTTVAMATSTANEIPTVLEARN